MSCLSFRNKDRKGIKDNKNSIKNLGRYYWASSITLATNSYILHHIGNSTYDFYFIYIYLLVARLILISNQRNCFPFNSFIEWILISKGIIKSDINCFIPCIFNIYSTVLYK